MSFLATFASDVRYAVRTLRRAPGFTGLAVFIMALGARRGIVARQVLVGALGLACLGLAVGVAGALTVGRTLESLLFEVRPVDPLTFVLAATVLLLVSAAASYVPARRAASVDPMIALREE